MLLLLATPARGETYIQAQNAGYAGLIALGAGVESETFGVSGMVGYVPELIAGEDLWSLTVKPEVRFWYMKAGVSLLASLDKDTFWWQPSKYPLGYYPPTGLRLAPFVGVEIVKSYGSALYIEVTCLDYYLELKARNPAYVRWTDILNMSVGVKWYLE